MVTTIARLIPLLAALALTACVHTTEAGKPIFDAVAGVLVIGAEVLMYLP